MLGRRIALAVVLAVAGVSAAACGKGGSASHQVVPGAPAGVVREVAGTVGATRPGAAPRTLKVGDTVAGDDVIETGADGSVLIELDHNHVTFTLPAGKKQQVAASLAWNQPVAGAQAASTSDEHSAAAGRAIERSAVDTEASGGGGGGGEPTPAVAAAPPEPPTAPEHAMTKGAPPKPPRPPDQGEGDGDKQAADDGLGQSAALTDSMPETGAAPPPPPPPPPPPTEETLAVPDTKVAHGSPGPLPVVTDTTVEVAVTGGLTSAEVAGVLDTGALHKCYRSAVGTATIVVTSTGKAGRVTTDAGATSTTCLRNAMKRLTFAKRKTPTTITIKWIELPE